MAMHLRRKLVAGNWKMNGSLAALAEFGPIAEAAREAGGVDVAICPPFTLIAPALTRAGGAVTVGAQDCHAHDSGAHTGCVSADMLLDAGAKLSGTVTGGDLTIETEFGKTQVAFADIAGVSGGAGVQRPLRVFLRCVYERGARFAVNPADPQPAYQAIEECWTSEHIVDVVDGWDPDQ